MNEALLIKPRPPRGRFAPTPSGPLHFGSLVTALASFLSARHRGGSWLLRIDDLDAMRCRVEHADKILRQLEAHGLHWDETPRFQSRHIDAYEAAFAQLRAQGLCYRCACTRATLAGESIAGIDGPVYAGTCRNADSEATVAAWRVRVPDGLLRIDDAVHGHVVRDLERDVGDFIVRRADGQIAYQLACVVDDRDQRITEIVRGADLIGSSVRQLSLLPHFSVPAPFYLHVPLILDDTGAKLSKQNHAASIEASSDAVASMNLGRALVALGQIRFAADCQGHVEDILQQAIANWNPARIPQSLALPAYA